MAHTPGPWEATDDGDINRQHNGKRLATVSRHNGRANARLMAASPRMLEACEKLVAWDESHGDAKLISEACSFARQAVRQATGDPK